MHAVGTLGDGHFGTIPDIAAVTGRWLRTSRVRARDCRRHRSEICFLIHCEWDRFCMACFQSVLSTNIIYREEQYREYRHAPRQNRLIDSKLSLVFKGSTTRKTYLSLAALNWVVSSVAPGRVSHHCAHSRRDVRAVQKQTLPHSVQIMIKSVPYHFVKPMR